MEPICYEIVHFHPAPGCDADAVRRGFAPSHPVVAACAGFLGRDLLPPSEEGAPWLDVVRWRSLEDALAAAKAFETHEAVASIMAVVDPASLRMEHRVSVDFG